MVLHCNTAGETMTSLECTGMPLSLVQAGLDGIALHWSKCHIVVQAR